MALGYAHPDHLLRELDSRQIGEWMAFSMLEPVGQPIPPDPEEQAEAERKLQREKILSGFDVMAANRKRKK